MDHLACYLGVYIIGRLQGYGIGYMRKVLGQVSLRNFVCVYVGFVLTVLF